MLLQYTEPEVSWGEREYIPSLLPLVHSPAVLGFVFHDVEHYHSVLLHLCLVEPNIPVLFPHNTLILAKGKGGPLERMGAKY